MSDPKKPPPIYEAGIQIETNGPKWFVNGSVGTLGCYARHKPTGKPVLLTNSHVMFPGYRATSGFAVYQPDYSSICWGGDRIATPVFDPTKKVRNAAADGAPEDLYDGYQDGKWFGGFNGTLGQTWIINPTTGTWMKTGHTYTCSKTDAAIAMLAPGVSFNNVFTDQRGEKIQIAGVNTDPLSVIGPSAGVAPAYSEYVRVLSKRMLIYGTMLSRYAPDGEPQTERRRDRFGVEHNVSPIFDVGFPLADAAEVGTKTLINQFVILPRPTPPKPKPGQTDDDYRKTVDYTKLYTPNQVVDFDFGDSGSIVVDQQGKVVALVALKMGFVADTMALRKDKDLIEFTSVHWVAVATPIQEVIDLFNIEIPPNYSGTAPAAGAEAPVYAVGFEESPEQAAQRQAIDRMRERLRATRRGKVLLGKMARHRREVQYLLTAVRAFNATWRQLNGQRYYLHFLKSLIDPLHKIPTEINGVTRSQLVDGLLPLLAQQGSPALQRDLEIYGGWAREILLHLETLDDLPELVSGQRPRHEAAEHVEAAP